MLGGAVQGGPHGHALKPPANNHRMALEVVPPTPAKPLDDHSSGQTARLRPHTNSEPDPPS